MSTIESRRQMRCALSPTMELVSTPTATVAAACRRLCDRYQQIVQNRLHHVPKKHKLLNLYQQLCQILVDFQKFFKILSPSDLAGNLQQSDH